MNSSKAFFLRSFLIILRNNGCILWGIVELIFQKVESLANIYMSWYRTISVILDVWSIWYSSINKLFYIESTGSESLLFFLLDFLIVRIIKIRLKFFWLKIKNQFWQTPMNETRFQFLVDNFNTVAPTV